MSRSQGLKYTNILFVTAKLVLFIEVPSFQGVLISKVSYRGQMSNYIVLITSNFLLCGEHALLHVQVAAIISEDRYKIPAQVSM